MITSEYSIMTRFKINVLMDIIYKRFGDLAVSV